MLEERPETPETPSSEQSETKPRRRAASRPAGPPKDAETETTTKPAKKTAKKSTAKKDSDDEKPTKKAAKKTSAKKASAKKEVAEEVATPAIAVPLFQAPDPVAAEAKPAKKSTRKTAKKASPESESDAVVEETAKDEDEESGTGRRRRRRGGRGRRKKGDESAESSEDASADEEASEDDGEEGEGGTRRRRRRRRKGSDADADGSPDDPPNTVTKVREPRKRDDVSSVKGSTRLEAKKQRRREGREAGRRRATILTESEFLARREAVNRVMVVRQTGERTQVAALEDGVLVEHYVHRGQSASMVGNVYLGRVQNVLPSMEAAFVDIGRGRNAVLYAGEVNWDAAGLDGQPRRIEFALKSGDAVLVQVTKDPVGQKGARLTSQISLPGRYLVYVPDGSMTGISRKLPDTERSRLKGILKRVMPEDAGVIVRTAAEGAAEEALERDVQRLQAQWEDISTKAETANAPALLSSEPDLAIKVVRDIFNEDVNELIISGDGAWDTIESYVSSVAPELTERLKKWVEPEDLFEKYRVDEQLLKGLDRKVYLPSGGSLVIDRTEAMTVIDVNTGKFVGAGGNLEETVTKNNLEAAEEIVRQLRLRDVGGIIVVDFIDMVLESNRELVLRRLLECLGRDRTKHQVAEVTSLGLVQMTRKRIGQGLLEVFSIPCEECGGRGVKVSLTDDHHHHAPSTYVEPSKRVKTGIDPAEAAARALEAENAPEEVLVIEPELEREPEAVDELVSEEPV